MTSCTVGVAPDGVSGTVLVDTVVVAVCEHTHVTITCIIDTNYVTHQQLQGCSANENSLLVS